MLLDGSVHISNDLDFVASRVLSSLGFTRHEYISPVAVIYILNCFGGPLVDTRVRRALSLALDRSKLIDEVLSGGAASLFGFVSPMHYGAAPDREVKQNLFIARRLLDEAGYAEGLTLNVDCPTRLPDESERLTACVRSQLAEIGVTLNVSLHRDRVAYAEMLRRKEIADLCVFDSSPMSTYRVLHEKIDSRAGGPWWLGYQNEDVEALIDKGRAIADRSARAAIWRKAYAALQDDPAWLTLYNPLRVIGLAGKELGFKMPIDGVMDAAVLPEL
jgi:peptide/nickel transport system substrate-binding protein